MSMNSENKVEAGGLQGAHYVNSNVNNPTYNITKYVNKFKAQAVQIANISNIHNPAIEISKIIDDYKKWVLTEEDSSQLSRKLEKLVINGKDFHITRMLSRNGEEISADNLLDKIPLSETSLVTGPAGSGKSTLAASTTVAWAKSSESRFDLVLFLSSLHKMSNLPLHKQLWGEFTGHIKEQDSSKIYEKLLEMKDRLLFIIDGLGKKCKIL